MPSSLHRGLLSVVSCLALVSTAAGGPPAPGDLPLDRLLATEISTASRYEQSVAQAPASVTIISAEEIRRYGWETLADVMQMVRGFYVSYDRNYHYVGVRGFSRESDYNNRLLLLLNGHPLNENVFGSAPFGTDLAIDLDAVERIEIVRGPGSSLYGTGAMFAVVNLITRSGAMLDGTHGSLGAGNNDRVRGAVYGGTGSPDGWDVTASAVLSRTDGRDLRYGEYAGEVARGLDFDDYEGALATVRVAGVSFMANAVRRRKGIPTGAFGVDFAHPDSHTVDERTLAELRYERELGASRKLTLRGFAHRYHYDGVYPYDEVPWLDRGEGRWVGGEAQVRFDLRSNHRFTAGAQYVANREAAYQFGPPEGPVAAYDMPSRVVSLFAEDEYQPLPDLSITLGLRYDDYSHLEGNAFSPRAAVIWDARRDTTVKLVYGRAYRSPSTYELAYVDPQGGVQGNPALGTEKVDTFELILERRISDGLYGVLDVFEYRMRDLVDPREHEGVLRFENVGGARARGVEAEIQGRFDRLWMHASLALQDARERGQGDAGLTNSPRRLVRFGVSSPFGARMHGALEGIYEGSRRTIRGGSTDEVFLANGRLAVDLRQRLQLALAVRNVLNRRWSTPGGYEHLQQSIEQDGRTVSLKLHFGL